MALMVATAMLLVTILKAPTIVPANQDFTETGETAAKVIQIRILQFQRGNRKLCACLFCPFVRSVFFLLLFGAVKLPLASYMVRNVRKNKV